MIREIWNTENKKDSKKAGEQMNIAVCTKKQRIRKFFKSQGNVEVFFIENINEVEVPEFDLIIADVDLCSGKLDVAKLQSTRTVYIMTELSEDNIDKLIQDFRIGEHPFTYTFSGKEYTVDLNDIVYFESRHKVVRGYNEAGEFIRFYDKLDEVQKKVDDFVFFLRVNKSYLVNFNYCTVSKDKVTIAERQIQISRTYKKDFEKRLEIIKSM